jgi:hypothetical protein
MFDRPLRSQCLIARSAREEGALSRCFLSCSQAKSMPARSFVQDSGTRSLARVESAYLGDADFRVDISQRGAGHLAGAISALGKDGLELAALLH